MLRRIACGVEVEADDEEEDRHDGFLQRYRAQRLQELRQVRSRSQAYSTNLVEFPNH